MKRMSSRGPYSGWQRPRCLVSNTADGRLEISRDVIDTLRDVTDPVDVVCVLGSYRTGKSYLMNKLAARNEGEKTVRVRRRVPGAWNKLQMVDLRRAH